MAPSQQIRAITVRSFSTGSDDESHLLFVLLRKNWTPYRPAIDADASTGIRLD